MTGDEVRQVFEPMLPQQKIDGRCQQFDVIERERKLNLGMFVRAMVILAGTRGAPTRLMSCALTWRLRSHTWRGSPSTGSSTCPWSSSWQPWPSGPWHMPGRSWLIYRVR
jgi:hypothetical protein